MQQQSAKLKLKDQRKALFKLDERIKNMLSYYLHQWRFMSKMTSKPICNVENVLAVADTLDPMAQLEEEY